MRYVLLFSALILASSCATTPPQMTPVERSARATRVIAVDPKASVTLLTDFFLAEGYSIDRYDEGTQMFQTAWSNSNIGAMGSALLGSTMEQKIQARVTAVADSTSRVEFWIYNRFQASGHGGYDQPEELNLYPARYDELLGHFDTFCGGRGVVTKKTSP